MKENPQIEGLLGDESKIFANKPLDSAPQTFPQLFLITCKPKKLCKTLKNCLFINFSSRVSALFSGNSKHFLDNTQVLTCAPQKIIVLGSSATFSKPSTLGFNTVLEGFSSSMSRVRCEARLELPSVHEENLANIASDNLPTLPSLVAQVQPSRFGGNVSSRNTTHTENIILALMSECIGCNSRRPFQDTSCTRPSLDRHP